MRNNAITLRLNHEPNNPRNSEGAFVTLRDGRVLFVYTRYYGKSWADHATADIVGRYSAGGGRSWSKADRIIVKNEGRLNVMSVSLLRLQDGRIALFYLKKDAVDDCRPYVRFSRDEGESWSKPVLCIPERGYFVVNNDRVIQLRDGRILMPAAFHRIRCGEDSTKPPVTDSRGIAMAFFSDDGGRIWKESANWLVIPVPGWSGLQEPGAIELQDGRLYGWARTDTGRQWEFGSGDRGVTWSPPVRSRFRSPCSPLCMKRVPSTGDLLAVWNDHDPKWKMKKARPSSWGRTPLALGVSSDDGRSWRHRRLIETDPRRGFCYTAIHFTDDAVLLAYCCGGAGSGVLQDLCVRRVGLDWIYGT
jgi:hypothetical protein